MIVECPFCSDEIEVDNEEFDGKYSVIVECDNCNEDIEIFNSGEASILSEAGEDEEEEEEPEEEDEEE